MNSKSANLAKIIARELIKFKLEEKIPTVANLAEKHHVGVGTIDKILKFFKDNQIIELQARGQMGTYLVKKDFLKLCEIADTNTFIGLLPLPNSNEYEGLATGLNYAFHKESIKFSINFKNGSKERLHSLLENRCDFIIASSFAAQQYCNEILEINQALALKNCNYYSNFYIIHNREADDDKSAWNIGYDDTSADSVYITETIFKNNKKKMLNYYNFPYAVVDGKIDAAVIHSKVFIPLELINKLKVEHIKNNHLNNSFYSAILTRKDNYQVNEVFNNIIDSSLIESIYKDVLGRKMEPAF